MGPDARDRQLHDAVLRQCGAPNYTELFPNARDLPIGLLNGVLDELTPITLSRDYASRFAALGYPYRLWEYALGRHSPALHGQTVDATEPWLAGARRVTDPATVTYVVDRTLFDPAFGLTYDRAYWVRDIRLAEAAAIGRVDATSDRGTIVGTAPVSGSGTSQAGPYLMEGADPVLRAGDGANHLALTLVDVDSVRIETVAADLSEHEPLTLDVDSSVPAVVTIAGFGMVSIPVGHSHRVLQPAGDSTSRGSSGAGSGPLDLLPLAAVLVLGRRRALRSM